MQSFTMPLDHIEFLQLVRLLERAEPERPPVGFAPEPNQEVVRFRSRVDFGFPGAAVAQLDGTEAESGEDAAYVLTSRLLNLFGRFGAMPTVYSERIAQRLSEGDAAGREFLDLFHHRLVTLWVKICKTVQPELQSVPAVETDTMAPLFALSGLGLASLNGSGKDANAPLLGGVGLPSRARIPAADLENLVRFHFDVPCRIKPFVGGWLLLNAEDQARLSAVRGTRLGCSGALGRRAWDNNSTFSVCLGPLAPDRFADFLPGGSDYAALVRLVRFHAGPDLSFSFSLQGETRQPKGALLSGEGGAALGWTALLAAQQAETPEPVTLYPEREPLAG